jgi:hypothetical protein
MTRAAPEAVIVKAEIVAGHDGSAELLVTLGYPNGAQGCVALDERTGLDLMAACGASHVDDLAGQSWRRILEPGDLSS